MKSGTRGPLMTAFDVMEAAIDAKAIHNQIPTSTKLLRSHCVQPSGLLRKTGISGLKWAKITVVSKWYFMPNCDFNQHLSHLLIPLKLFFVPVNYLVQQHICLFMFNSEQLSSSPIVRADSGKTLCNKFTAEVTFNGEINKVLS